MKPGLGPIRRVTVVTADLAASTNAYRDYLGYDLLDRGQIDAQLAQGWAAPAMAGAGYTTVGPASGIGGTVRLVQGTIPADYRPARSYGWAALEISVPDVDALAKQLADSPFRTLIAPSPLAGLTSPALRAMQVVGPSGELIYFTEILGPLPPFDLPSSSGAIDGVFIVVIAAADLEATRRCFETRFDVERASDRQVAVQVINAAFELAATTGHRISSLKLLGQAAIEIDQYPQQATPRPVAEGFLPPGVASVSLCVASPNVAPRRDEPARVLIGPDGLRVELVTD